jgi:hypothetical protein
VRITQANMEELASVLDDLETAASDVSDPLTTWIDAQDDPEMREERREARDEFEDNIDSLESACYEVLKVLNPKLLNPNTVP